MPDCPTPQGGGEPLREVPADDSGNHGGERSDLVRTACSSGQRSRMALSRGSCPQPGPRGCCKPIQASRSACGPILVIRPCAHALDWLLVLPRMTAASRLPESRPAKSLVRPENRSFSGCLPGKRRIFFVNEAITVAWCQQGGLRERDPDDAPARHDTGHHRRRRRRG